MARRCHSGRRDVGVVQYNLFIIYWSLSKSEQLVVKYRLQATHANKTPQNSFDDVKKNDS